jgi:purine-binding chemotaxis protein CheW
VSSRPLPNDTSLQRSLVGFLVGHAEYALPTAAVRAIKTPGRVNPLPHLPLGVLGVYEYRARVIPVLDLRICFGSSNLPPEQRPKWLILESGRGLICLVVDNVTGVFDCGARGLGAIPPLGTRPATCHVAGVAHHGTTLAFVLDLASFHAAALCLDNPAQAPAAAEPKGYGEPGATALPGAERPPRSLPPPR